MRVLIPSPICSIFPSKPWRPSAMATCIRGTDYAHLVATLEIFIGLSSLALFTGLIFTRFPDHAAALCWRGTWFSARTTASPMPTTRLANARQALCPRRVAETGISRRGNGAGRRFRRFAPLALRHTRNTAFRLELRCCCRWVGRGQPLSRSSGADWRRPTPIPSSCSMVSTTPRASRSTFAIPIPTRTCASATSSSTSSPRARTAAVIDYRKFHDTIEEARSQLDDETAAGRRRRGLSLKEAQIAQMPAHVFRHLGDVGAAFVCARSAGASLSCR